MAELTVSQLKELLHYTPKTGNFIWLKSLRNGWVGKSAGWIDKDGYVHIRVRDRLYPAHRLAYLYMMGKWPSDGFIDHQNTMPGDNRWGNIRNATKRINQENRRRANRNNKTGFLGVYMTPKGRFQAKIESHGRAHYLGIFDTPEEAYSVYVTAKRQLHEGCTL